MLQGTLGSHGTGLSSALAQQCSYNNLRLRLQQSHRYDCQPNTIKRHEYFHLLRDTIQKANRKVEDSSQPETERIAVGAQTPPLRFQNMHALQTAMHSILPTPSHPLLRKLRFHSECRPRWTRGGSRTESEQLEGRAETAEEIEQGQTEENEENEDNEGEEEEEEEEINHSSLLSQHRSRSRRPRSPSPFDYINSNDYFRPQRWLSWNRSEFSGPDFSLAFRPTIY